MAPKHGRHRRERHVQWAPVVAVVAPAPDPAVAAEPRADDDDDAASQASQGSLLSASTVPGDSVHTDSEVEEDGRDAAVAARRDAAAAAAGDAAPQAPVHNRPPRPMRNTTPVQEGQQGAAVAAERRRIWDLRNDSEHIGNLGWLFGNWGQTPRDARVRQHVMNTLRRNPAMIIGLAECQQVSEDFMRTPGEPAVAGAAEGSLEARQAYQYLTIRGNEESSVLIGLRAQTGNCLSLVFWERRREGTYRSRSGGRVRRDAYTRVLIARVDTDHNVGFLGRSHNVMVIHLHHHMANGKWKQPLLEFWGWLAEKIRTHDVKVVMGDFNMSLFGVIPELRSRGVEIDLCAWYPWKASSNGERMSDSCGIFFVNMPGEYTLYKSLADLHDRDASGILFRPTPAVAGWTRPEIGHDGFDRIEKQAGPGMPLVVYLPKRESNLANKLKPTLEPCPASAAAVKGKGKGNGCNRNCIKIREKRLHVDLWKLDGEHHKGSHFPICAFTNNVGRRSPERLQARHERAASRSGGWRGWGGNAPGGWGGWDWGGWDGAWEGGAWEGSSGSSLGRTT